MEGKAPTTLKAYPAWVEDFNSGLKLHMQFKTSHPDHIYIFFFLMKTFMSLHLSSHKAKLSISVKVAWW